MKENLKIIRPAHGLGDLKLGLYRDDVKNLLGEPTEVEIFSYPEDAEDGSTEAWHYDELELSLAFDEPDNWRLGSIALTSEFYELDKKQLIGMKKNEVISLLKRIKVTDYELEDLSTDESPGNELISADAIGLYFWFEHEVLNELQMGPLVADDDTVSWP